jgi:tRNA-Thr(GGU) m(6)t(6)A37 methyltransferase TsaA
VRVTTCIQDVNSVEGGDVVEFKPIGKIQTPFSSKEDCPIQPFYASGAEGRVELFQPFDQGLKDIAGFSHIYLIYGFDRAGEIQMVRPTFLDDIPHGIYASRHPCRPNGIGLSIVQLLEQDDPFLTVSGVDMLDGTPLLDIKPYLPKFDAFPGASEGWTAGREFRKKPTGRE